MRFMFPTPKPQQINPKMLHRVIMTNVEIVEGWMILPSPLC